MFNPVFMNNAKRTLFLFVLTTLTLIAETNNTLPSQTDSMAPDVPEFSITYLGEPMVCSPTRLIKTKNRKDLVAYECRGEHRDKKRIKAREEERGVEETVRLRKEARDKMAEGMVYSVEIPFYATNNPTRARLIAERKLNNRPYGKYLPMFRPAKLYLSIRPQVANSGEDGKVTLRNADSRGGFFYYYQFSNDLELMFQYEAKADLQDDSPFINVSDASDITRRLSYFALKSGGNAVIIGKYWSAYYDIASFTDHYMAYGAQASGAFNAGTDGGPSGTGRPDHMLQVRRKDSTYDAALQVQLKHDTLRDFYTDYLYTVAGSFIYKGWENVKAGASVAYGKFDEITPQMLSIGITDNDWSSIVGVEYKKENFSVHATFSYTENHSSDDQGIYFNAIGTELYMRYDIDESFRLVGGGNWLIPKDTYYYSDDDAYYKSQYSIRDLLFSLQYTFGEKTFDDLVYVEVSLPNGKLANGDRRDTSVAIGLRYLLDN